jgi:uncharacterized membrane protein YeaQ/YmgE (transglycosylase-associated protein family)
MTPFRQEELMSIIAWIIVGLIGGALAKLLLPGRDPGGIILTILLGIAGAILGGFIAVAVNISDGVDDFDIGSIVLSIVGSIIILLVYRMIVGTDRDTVR